MFKKKGFTLVYLRFHANVVTDIFNMSSSFEEKREGVETVERITKGVNNSMERLQYYARSPDTSYRVLSGLMNYALNMTPGGVEERLNWNFYKILLPMHILDNRGLTGVQLDELNELILGDVSKEHVEKIINTILGFKSHGTFDEDLHPVYRLVQAFRELLLGLDRIMKPCGWWRMVNDVSHVIPSDLLEADWEEAKRFLDESVYGLNSYRSYCMSLLQQPGCTEGMLVEACRHHDKIVQHWAFMHVNCPEIARVEAVLARRELLKG